MTNLDPDQVAAYDQAQAYFGPKIRMSVAAVALGMRFGCSDADAYAQAVLAIHGAYGTEDPEALIGLIALSWVETAKFLNTSAGGKNA